MKLMIKVVSIVFLFLSLSVGSLAIANTVEVFTQHKDDIRLSQSLKRADVKVYVLQEIKHIEQQLSQGINDDSFASQQKIRKRITPEIKKQLGQAWRSHILARNLGVKYLPAIVINRTYVYYGHDVDRAIKLAQDKAEKLK